MGTDIHGVFQRRTNEGKWEDVPTKFSFNRHYMLFAWLGNVRNGYGFAGVPTHEPLVPLSDSRGLPDDFETIEGDPTSHRIPSVECLPEWMQEWEAEHPSSDPDELLNLWMGDHSHSWLLADEILAGAQHLPKILQTGIVDRATYLKWDGITPPESWCGGISGPDVEVFEPDWTKNEVILLATATHIRIAWQVNVLDELRYFVDEVQRLKDEHGKVRFVFGFDS